MEDRWTGLSDNLQVESLLDRAAEVVVRRLETEEEVWILILLIISFVNRFKS